MTSFLALRPSHECLHVNETLSADPSAQHRDGAAMVPVGAEHRRPAEVVAVQVEAGHSNSIRQAH